MEMAYPEDVRNMAAEALRVWLYEWYDNIRDILWDRIEPFEEPPLATHTT
jgi:hypothetical protein